MMSATFNLPAGLSPSDERQTRAVMRFLEANPRVVRGRTVLSLPGAANASICAFAVTLGASKGLLLRGVDSASVEEAEESAVITANAIPSSRCTVSARPFAWPSGSSAASLTRIELAIEYLSFVPHVVVCIDPIARSQCEPSSLMQLFSALLSIPGDAKGFRRSSSGDLRAIRGAVAELQAIKLVKGGADTAKTAAKDASGDSLMLDEFLSASVVDRCCLVGFTSASVTARGVVDSPVRSALELRTVSDASRDFSGHDAFATAFATSGATTQSARSHGGATSSQFASPPPETVLDGGSVPSKSKGPPVRAIPTTCLVASAPSTDEGKSKAEGPKDLCIMVVRVCDESEVEELADIRSGGSRRVFSQSKITPSSAATGELKALEPSSSSSSSMPAQPSSTSSAQSPTSSSSALRLRADAISAAVYASLLQRQRCSPFVNGLPFDPRSTSSSDCRFRESSTFSTAAAANVVFTRPSNWILATGIAQKRRDGVFREGWARRRLVLTRNRLFYFLALQPYADAVLATGGEAVSDIPEAALPYSARDCDRTQDDMLSELASGPSEARGPSEASRSGRNLLKSASASPKLSTRSTVGVVSGVDDATQGLLGDGRGVLVLHEVESVHLMPVPWPDEDEAFATIQRPSSYHERVSRAGSSVATTSSERVAPVTSDGHSRNPSSSSGQEVGGENVGSSEILIKLKSQKSIHKMSAQQNLNLFGEGSTELRIRINVSPKRHVNEAVITEWFAVLTAAVSAAKERHRAGLQHKSSSATLSRATVAENKAAMDARKAIASAAAAGVWASAALSGSAAAQSSLAAMEVPLVYAAPSADGLSEHPGLGASQIPPLPATKSSSPSRKSRSMGSLYPARAVAWAIFACAVAAAWPVPEAISPTLANAKSGADLMIGSCATASATFFTPWWLFLALTFCNAVATTMTTGAAKKTAAVTGKDSSFLRLCKTIHAAVKSSSLEATAATGGKANKAKALRALRLAGSSAPTDMPGSAAVSVAAASLALALEALPLGVQSEGVDGGDSDVQKDFEGADMARTQRTKSLGALRPGFSLKAISSTGFGEHSVSSDNSARTADVPAMSWSPCDGTGILLRTRGYGTTRKKDRSRPGLYKCLSVDYTCPPQGSEDFLSHIARTFSALGGDSALDFADEAKGQGLQRVRAGSAAIQLPLPRLLCVNLIVHTVAPSMWGEATPDPGRNIVLWFHVNADCIDSFVERSGATSADNGEEAFAASDLFSKFYSMAFDDEDIHAKSTEEAEAMAAKREAMRQRFKVVVRVPEEDMAKFGSTFNGVAGNLNGKPKLLKKNVLFFRGPQNENCYRFTRPASSTKAGEEVMVAFDREYFEIDVVVAKWNYLSRYAAWQGRTQLSVLKDVCFAFTVEGRTDEELPERVVASAALHYLDYDKATELPM